MDHFQSALNALQASGAHEPKTLNTLRQNAFNRFTELGLPNKKWEDWQFTDFSIFNKEKFRMPTADDLVFIERANIGLLSDCYTVCIINGHYQPELTELPTGVQVSTLSDVFLSNEIRSMVVENPFIALNTALMNSGLVIAVPNNIVLDKPIHYKFITSGLNEPIMNHPRLIINVGKNSAVTFIEHYQGVNTGAYWNNCVTVADLNENAGFNHVRIQEDTGYHIDNVQYTLQKNARLHSTAFNVKTQLYRSDIQTRFYGENGNAELVGLGLLNNDQHMDNHVIVDHEKPHCTSRQFFKYVLDGTASGVFNGRVIVHPNSQKTDSSQTNKNLLMSAKATMHSNPQLEIYADDVRCRHGSTTGQLSEDVLYYMRSRGIDHSAAQKLMVEGFAKEVLINVPHEITANYLYDQLNGWLVNG